MAYFLTQSAESEARALQAFFKETLSLDFYGVHSGVAQFRLRAVDDIPVSSKILLQFNRDKSYIPAELKRSYVGLLNVSIMGVVVPDRESCIGYYSKRLDKHEFCATGNRSLSIVDMVREASGYQVEKSFTPSYGSGFRLVKAKNKKYIQECCMKHLGRQNSLPLQDKIQSAAARSAVHPTDTSRSDLIQPAPAAPAR